jgi:hypothetical protein
MHGGGGGGGMHSGGMHGGGAAMGGGAFRGAAMGGGGFQGARANGGSFRNAQASAGGFNGASNFGGRGGGRFAGGGYHHGRGHGFGRGAAFVGGLAVGSALGYGYGGYGDGYYAGDAYYDGDYDSGPSYVVSTEEGGNPAYCAQRYRSYDPASGTYLGYDGLRHPCEWKRPDQIIRTEIESRLRAAFRLRSWISMPHVGTLRHAPLAWRSEFSGVDRKCADAVMSGWGWKVKTGWRRAMLQISCPKCGAKGEAKVSEDDYPLMRSPGFSVDELPAGFEVVKRAAHRQDTVLVHTPWYQVHILTRLCPKPRMDHAGDRKALNVSTFTISKDLEVFSSPKNPARPKGGRTKKPASTEKKDSRRKIGSGPKARNVDYMAL